MPEYQIHNEKELLLRIAEGDEKAFSLLYTRFWDELYSLALTILKSPTYAEDTIQEVFLKLWLKRSTLPFLQEFKPYFMAMTRNEIINSLRQRKQKLKIISIGDVQLLGEFQNTDKLNLKEITDSVKEVLVTFSTKQHEAFILSREQGLTHEQIATELQISKKTVANLITLSLNEIRNHLGKKGLLVALYCLSLQTFF